MTLEGCRYDKSESETFRIRRKTDRRLVGKFPKISPLNKKDCREKYFSGGRWRWDLNSLVKGIKEVLLVGFGGCWWWLTVEVGDDISCHSCFWLCWSFWKRREGGGSKGVTGGCSGGVSVAAHDDIVLMVTLGASSICVLKLNEKQLRSNFPNILVRCPKHGDSEYANDFF